MQHFRFGNLSKIAGVLGVTMSELLSGLEAGGVLDMEPKRLRESSNAAIDAERRMIGVQKLVRRLRFQFAAMDRTMVVLEELQDRGLRKTAPVGRPAKRRT